MDKKKTRIIVSLVAVIILMATFFSVLAVEESKRLAKFDRSAIERKALVESIGATMDARKEYYAKVAEQRARLEEQMAKDKATYEDLLKRQPELVASQKQQTTQVVQETVPVTSTVTVPATSASSTAAAAPKRTTKTS